MEKYCLSLMLVTGLVRPYEQFQTVQLHCQIANGIHFDKFFYARHFIISAGLCQI